MQDHENVKLKKEDIKKIPQFADLNEEEIESVFSFLYVLAQIEIKSIKSKSIKI